jgi:hypothetical protein
VRPSKALWPLTVGDPLNKQGRASHRRDPRGVKNDDHPASAHVPDSCGATCARRGANSPCCPWASRAGSARSAPRHRGSLRPEDSAARRLTDSHAAFSQSRASQVCGATCAGDWIAEPDAEARPLVSRQAPEPRQAVRHTRTRGAFGEGTALEASDVARGAHRVASRRITASCLRRWGAIPSRCADAKRHAGDPSTLGSRSAPARLGAAIPMTAACAGRVEQTRRAGRAVVDGAALQPLARPAGEEALCGGSLDEVATHSVPAGLLYDVTPCRERAPNRPWRRRVPRRQRPVGHPRIATVTRGRCLLAGA